MRVRVASGAHERQSRETEEPPRDRAKPALAAATRVEEPAIALLVLVERECGGGLELDAIRHPQPDREVRVPVVRPADAEHRRLEA